MSYLTEAFEINTEEVEKIATKEGQSLIDFVAGLVTFDVWERMEGEPEPRQLYRFIRGVLGEAYSGDTSDVRDAAEAQGMNTHSFIGVMLSKEVAERFG